MIISYIFSILMILEPSYLEPGFEETFKFGSNSIRSRFGP